MTDKTESSDFADMLKDTSSYMYKVTMLVQVLAPTKEIADAKLDQDGGYVTKRTVEYVRSVLLYTDKEESEAVSEKDSAK
jgi:hypothetical protein